MSSRYVINTPLIVNNTLTTSQPIVSTNLTSTNATISSINTDKVSFGTSNNQIGSIYFQTGSATGCFIPGLNYNSTGSDHYVYYNSSNKELSQASPNYFFSYSTSQQTFSNGSVFQPVTFNNDPILYHTFQHTSGGSVFTGTFDSPVTLELTYTIHIYCSTAAARTVAAVLYLDGVAIPGSYKSISININPGETTLNNTVLVNISNGSHSIELQAATNDKNFIAIGAITPIINPAPTGSYSTVNLTCRRII